MTWPHDIPEDLRWHLDSILDARSLGSPEIWGTVREWLITHEVAVPETLPERPRPERFFDQ